MKVFFLSSIAVNQELRDSYRTIIKILEEQGQRVSGKHSLELPSEVENLSPEDSEQRAKNLLKEMLQSDFVVFEGTKPTTGGGYYLNSALQRSLPVLYLTQEEYKGLYLASSNRLLKIKQYHPSDLKELQKIIKDFISFTNKKRLNNRFNLMISDTTDEFLNKVSKNYGISKADFIRDLIYRAMEQE